MTQKNSLLMQILVKTLDIHFTVGRLSIPDAEKEKLFEKLAELSEKINQLMPVVEVENEAVN